MAGTIVTSTLSDGTNTGSTTDAIKGSARAWVNFNGSTSAIRASYNVSSVTRNSLSDYTVNFTGTFVDSNYGALCAAEGHLNSPANAYTYLAPTARTTTSARFAALAPGVDCTECTVAIFR